MSLEKEEEGGGGGGGGGGWTTKVKLSEDFLVTSYS